MSTGKSFKGSVMLGTGFVLSDGVFLLVGKSKMSVSSHMPLREGGSRNFPARVGRRRVLCEEFRRLSWFEDRSL